ncbi:MAG: ABC transporter permease subunit [Cyanobacteria bacterium]|nr:ABC transporter permease subunit [Cyanobacteriota bacterium]
MASRLGKSPPWWQNRRLVPWLVQASVGLVLVVVIAFLLGNLVRNLSAAGLLLSWRWLGQPASFDIAETLLPFNASQPYWRGLLAGLVNTLRVVGLGFVGATLVGTLVGSASFSRNGLVKRLARIYVELIRNIPLLLQLVFWYFVVFLALPNGAAAIQLPGIVLAKSGLFLPGFEAGFQWSGPTLVDGVWQAPLRFTPEFGALLTGLVVYTGAFIAEVVRGGIAAVPKGQWEAATSLGLGPLYISLAKNSSLAVACGYTDLYSVAETSLNQTGRAIEVIVILLAAYLAIDLVISLLMNGLNRLVQIKER